MKRIIVEDMIDVAQIMHDKVATGCTGVCFVGIYEDAAELIKELLMMYDETTVNQIAIEMVEYDGYDKEYLVTLDNEMAVWCQKAFNDYCNEYFYVEDECVLVADDCNSAILKNIKSDEVYEVSYDLDDEECDGSCECCQCSGNDNHEEIIRVATDDNGKLRGFEKSWSTHEDGLNYHSTYSFYSSNEDMLKDMLSNFNIKY